MQYAPDIQVGVVLDVEDQARKTADRPEAHAIESQRQGISWRTAGRVLREVRDACIHRGQEALARGQSGLGCVPVRCLRGILLRGAAPEGRLKSIGTEAVKPLYCLHSLSWLNQMQQRQNPDAGILIERAHCDSPSPIHAGMSRFPCSTRPTSMCCSRSM